MAKKRKTSRKIAKPKTRRRARKGSAGDIDPMNVVAAILVLLLIGLGIYFYQANQKTAATGPVAPAAVTAEKK